MTSKGGVATHQLTIQTVAVRTAQVCARVCVCVRVGEFYIWNSLQARDRETERNTQTEKTKDCMCDVQLCAAAAVAQWESLQLKNKAYATHAIISILIVLIASLLQLFQLKSF